MLSFWWVIPVAVAIAMAVQCLRARRAQATRGRRPLSKTSGHYRALYSRRNFLRLGAMTAASAALAYSGLDEAAEEWHAENVKGETSDQLSSFLHSFGERFWFAYWAAFAAADSFVASTPLTRWGRTSFESMVCGLPMLWGTQRLLGAARPKDHTHGPRFLPFADQNAASGHAFISSIPLFVAHNDIEDRKLAAAPLALVPWVGWSRLNDRKHYVGQILLGWLIAWMAAQAVDE